MLNHMEFTAMKYIQRVNIKILTCNYKRSL